MPTGLATGGLFSLQQLLADALQSLEKGVVEPYGLDANRRPGLSCRPLEGQVDRAQALWLGDVLSDSMRPALSPHLAGLLRAAAVLPSARSRAVWMPSARFSMTLRENCGACRLAASSAGRAGGIVQPGDDSEDEAAPLCVAEPDILFEERRNRKRGAAAPEYLRGAPWSSPRRGASCRWLDGGLGLAQGDRLAGVLLVQPDEEEVGVRAGSRAPAAPVSSR